MDPTTTVALPAKTSSAHSGFATTVAGHTGLAPRVMNALAATQCRLMQRNLKIQPNICRLRHNRLRLGCHLGFMIIGLNDSGFLQSIVSGTDLLEPIGRFRAAITIRVPAHGQAAIGALDLSRRSILRNPQNCVRTSFHAAFSRRPK